MRTSLAILLISLPLVAGADPPELPARWTVSLSGRMGETAFDGEAAVLELHPPRPGDPNPLRLLLVPADPAAPRGIFVSSHQPDPLGGQTFAAIEATATGLKLRLVPGATPAGYPSWFLPPGAGDHPLTALPDVALAERGELELSWADGGIRGTLSFEGRTSLGAVARLQARIEPGGKAASPPPPPLPVPTAPLEPLPAVAGFEDLRQRGFDQLAAGRHGEAVASLSAAREALRLRHPGIETDDGVFSDGYYITEQTLTVALAVAALRAGQIETVLEALRANVAAGRALFTRRGYVDQAPGATVRHLGLELLDLLRAQQESEEDRIELLEKGQRFYAELLSFFVALEAPDEVLLVSEASRGRALSDLLDQRHHADAAAWRRAVRSPSAAALRVLVTRLDAPVVEYFAGEEALIIVWIHPDGEIRFTTRPIGRNELAARVEALRQSIAGGAADCPDPGKSGRELRPSRCGDLLRDLYQILFPAALEADLPEEGPVVLVPHGPLFGLPFGALVDGHGRSVVARWALSSVPSLLALPPAAAPVSGARRLLAVGAPDQRHAPDLLRLEGIPHQFATIAERFYPGGNAAIKTGAAAAEPTLSEAPSGGVLYLAAHAAAHRDEVGGPALVLSPAPGSDGFLEPGEIASHDLPLELTVLAACEGQRGAISSDGVYSLARGLLVAGSQAVLASLWQVGQDSTFHLIHAFHDEWLRQGHSKAEALRRAQQQLAASYPHQPTFWAGFTLIGGWK
ncbi:MAG TPA: CHAT domain-containing protein [Thermoanaerobaculia bacterium]|nr:CHAT domain-containing protein [Thermoanaerobaculia bacterium]